MFSKIKNLAVWPVSTETKPEEILKQAIENNNSPKILEILNQCPRMLNEFVVVF